MFWGEARVSSLFSTNPTRSCLKLVLVVFRMLLVGSNSDWRRCNEAVLLVTGGDGSRYVCNRQLTTGDDLMSLPKVIGFALIVAIVLSLTTVHVEAAETTLSASADVWIREAGADGIFESDLMSVWSSAGNDGARRYGVVEFDVSSLAGHSIMDAQLRLWAGPNGFSDDLKPIKQSAVSIDTSGGTPTTGMTWNVYHNEYDAGATSLETLGTVDFSPAGPGDLDAFVESGASLADRLTLQSAASSTNGLFTLVLIADEDGTDYAKSWGDGPDGLAGMDAELVITSEPIPEPSTLLLAALGLLGLQGIRRRRRK